MNTTIVSSSPKVENPVETRRAIGKYLIQELTMEFPQADAQTIIDTVSEITRDLQIKVGDSLAMDGPLLSEVNNLECLCRYRIRRSLRGSATRGFPSRAK